VPTFHSVKIHCNCIETVSFFSCPVKNPYSTSLLVFLYDFLYDIHLIGAVFFINTSDRFLKPLFFFGRKLYHLHTLFDRLCLGF